MREQENSFSFPSDPEEVNKLDAFVDRITHQYHLTDEVSCNIRLSLTEAVVNAIVHGNQADATKKVSIKLTKQTKALTICVCDEGIGFNPETIPDPTTPHRITMCGGRGIFLMRNLSNRCNFKAGGTEVEMIFKLPTNNVE
jgi:serine/threonine-protein kinase RsbW